jgi:hypothetical protein
MNQNFSDAEQAQSPDLNNANKKWLGYLVSQHTARQILDGIKKNNLPFLPNEKGVLETKPIYNASTGFMLNAKELFPVMMTQKEKGYASNVVYGYNAVNNAGTRIRKNEKGVFYNFIDKDKNYRHAAFFFPEQTENPEKCNASIRQQNLLSDQTLKIENVDDYLPKYLAACKSGAKVVVEPQIAEEFKENLAKIATQERIHNSEKILNKVFFEADKKSSEIVKGIQSQLGRIPPAKEKKIEKNIER